MIGLFYPKNFFVDMKLAIISHTAHYKNPFGDIVGWGPTVREINYLALHFEKIIHIACLHTCRVPASSLKYTESNIEFVPIPPSGGQRLVNKLGVIKTIPAILNQISKVVDRVDYFQIRLPAGFGPFLLPYLKILKPGAKYWIKYAGNWDQDNNSFGNTFQKWWLRKNLSRCKVTINGHWLGQTDHLISFENPCIESAERVDGLNVIMSKSYSDLLNFVFVGQLIDTKGVPKIIAAFKELKNHPRIGTLHFIGDGIQREEYERRAIEAGLQVRFHGYLSKEDVNGILKECHSLLLPSDSEGFPKVVAEGMNYGCIPVVSNISCLSQYVISGTNGFLMSSNDISGLISSIKNLLNLSGSSIKDIAYSGHEAGVRFTYDYYKARLFNEIII